MVPNAHGTLLGGAIVPGRNNMKMKVEEMGSPLGLRRAFKPATSTTL
jgi:hypothetical protein